MNDESLWPVRLIAFGILLFLVGAFIALILNALFGVIADWPFIFPAIGGPVALVGLVRLWWPTLFPNSKSGDRR